MAGQQLGDLLMNSARRLTVGTEVEKQGRQIPTDFAAGDWPSPSTENFADDWSEFDRVASWKSWRAPTRMGRIRFVVSDRIIFDVTNYTRITYVSHKRPLLPRYARSICLPSSLPVARFRLPSNDAGSQILHGEFKRQTRLLD